MGSRTWFKIFSEKWLCGTSRQDPIEVRGAFIDLLAMANSGLYGDDGIIKLPGGIGLTDEQIASIMNVDITIWLKAKQRLIETNRIKVGEYNIISIINWKKFQSDYNRQKPHRNQEFIRLRERIKERDDYTCQNCGKHETELRVPLCIHHIDNDPSNYNEDNLITLCINCHSNLLNKSSIKKFNKKVQVKSSSKKFNREGEGEGEGDRDRDIYNKKIESIDQISFDQPSADASNDTTKSSFDTKNDTTNSSLQASKEKDTPSIKAKKRKTIKFEYNDPLFEQFWAVYPRKIGKGKAWECWRKIRPDPTLVEKMIRTIEAFKKTRQWIREKGKFIPHPSTWLNQGRWDDEVPEGEEIW